jgi:Rrf2 family protein
MKFTRATSYALHALVHMSAQKDNRPMPSHLVAQDRGIPERFLLKVLKPLVSAGVLHSVKGPNGGYRLAKTPDKITLLEVIEAVDGPIQGQAFFEGQDAKALQKKMQALCNQAAESVRRQYQKVRISDLLGKM